jgi:hypothetical protein
MIVIRLASQRAQATSFCTEFIRAEGFRMPPGCRWQDRATSFTRCCMNQVLPMSRLPEIESQPKRPKPIGRHRIVSQLWRAAERQVNAVEARLLTLADEPLALEREAKTLGIIARTVRELLAIEEEKAKAKGAGKADDSNQPDAARTVAEFRRELAEKLEQLRAERAGDGAAGKALARSD